MAEEVTLITIIVLVSALMIENQNARHPFGIGKAQQLIADSRNASHQARRSDLVLRLLLLLRKNREGFSAAV